MRRFIGFLLVLFASVWLGLQIAKDPGYALFAYRNWTVEMPLWLAIIVLVIVVFLVYFLLRLITGTSHLGQRWRAWWQRRRMARSRNLTQQGFISLSEGDWIQAEKELMRAVNNAELPILNYLGAAYAAQQQRALARRDDYFQLAKTAATPETELALGLARAWFELQAEHYADAQIILEGLLDKVPEQTQVLSLLKQLYWQQKNWQALVSLLPTLQRQKVLVKDEYPTFAIYVYREWLLQMSDHPNPELMRDCWQRLPKLWQKEASLVNIYVDFLIKQNMTVEALQIIRHNLKTNWDDNLVYKFGLLTAADTYQQLEQAEAWLPAHRSDPILLLTLGRLSKHCQLWGKARSYFESSAAAQPRVETYRELGTLYMQLHDTSNALTALQKGLELVKDI